jgi:MFS family permease
MLFAATGNFTQALIFLFGAGMAQILIMNLCNSLVQLQVEENMRGRVMGIYTFVFFGLMPFGALWIGTIAQLLSERIAIMIASIITLVYAILVYSLDRPIWRLK